MLTPNETPLPSESANNALALLTAQKQALLSTPLRRLASDNPAAIEVVLRQSVLARLSDFDLIGDLGYAFLRDELPTDFPYLTLSDLNEIMKLGIKGKLKEGKYAPQLNVSLVCEWVEKHAPQMLSYYQHTFPEAMEWVATAGLTPEVVDYLRLSEALKLSRAWEVVASKISQLLKQAHWPDINPNMLPDCDPKTPVAAQQRATYHRFATELWPAFAAKYPEFARANLRLLPQC